METKFAKIFSIAFQPLLIPTYTLLILFNLKNHIALGIPPAARQMIMGMVFITTFLLPAIFLLFLYKRGIIKTLQMDSREERIFPMIITCIFYLTTYYIIRKFQLDTIYLRLFLGSVVTILLSLIVSLYWKISMHMMGIGGFAGSLAGISQALNTDMATWIIIALFCSGLTGFARLRLNAHTPGQVYAGFLSGFFILYFFFWL
jgi:membrane-associated phospholipid phosphatase